MFLLTCVFLLLRLVQKSEVAHLHRHIYEENTQIEMVKTVSGTINLGMNKELLDTSIRNSTEVISNPQKLEEILFDTADLDEPKLARRGLKSFFSCDSVGKFFKNRTKQRPVPPSRVPPKSSSGSLSVPISESLNRKVLDDILPNDNLKVIPTVNGEFTDKRGKLRTRNEWPIVYSKEYDISLYGIEKLHPFDAKKWGNIYSFLKKEHMLSYESVSIPDEVDDEILLNVHTAKYLDSLKSSCTIAQVTEICCVGICPNSILDERYLKAMRFQVGGSILAGELAMHRGWAINIGGGFHHANGNYGEGFCPYADITQLIKWLFEYYPDHVKKAMIVDLDAHQGNGHEKDFMYDKRVFIMDVYNAYIYPWDRHAKNAISCKVELLPHTADEDYLKLVDKNLEESLRSFRPDILVYNAGTDILKGDCLGQLDISAQGIIKRDKLVFMKARRYGVPIVMVTSGGYQKKTAKIIAKSILNLKELNLISK